MIATVQEVCFRVFNVLFWSFESAGSRLNPVLLVIAKALWLCLARTLEKTAELSYKFRRSLRDPSQSRKKVVKKSFKVSVRSIAWDYRHRYRLMCWVRSFEKFGQAVERDEKAKCMLNHLMIRSAHHDKQHGKSCEAQSTR